MTQSEDRRPSSVSVHASSPASVSAKDSSSSTAPSDLSASDDIARDRHQRLSSGYPNQVDRSVVFNEALSHTALWAVRVAIVAVVGYGLFLITRQFWQGILPIIFALILCTVLAAPANWLKRHHTPAGLAAILTILGFFASFGLVMWLIAPSVVRQSRTLYLQGYEAILSLQLWAQNLPIDQNSTVIGDIITRAGTWAQQQVGTIAGGVFSGITTATSIVITTGVVLVLTFFFLKDGDRFLPWLRRATGRTVGWHMTELFSRGWITLSGFVKAQALVSLVDAVFIGLGLLIIRVPLALALAVLTFCAGFIPIVGAVVAGVLAILVALVSLGLPQAIATAVLVILVQQIEGNILSPLLQSKAMDLHPVIILVSVILGSGLFGIIGAFLAVPTAAMLAVLLRYLQDIAVLRSGERKASDMTFLTPEGTLTGRLTEEAGNRWRENHQELQFLLDESDVVKDKDQPLNIQQDSEASEQLSRMAEVLTTATHQFSEFFKQYSAKRKN